MSLSIRDQSQVWGFSAWSELNYFVYRKLSSWDAFFKWYHNRAKWNIFTVLAPAANTTNIDYEQSLIFYCSQSTTNNDQFRVNTQDLLSYNLIKHRDGHKEQNIGQPETRIMKAKENYKQLSKRSTNSFSQNFSSLFAYQLKGSIQDGVCFCGKGGLLNIGKNVWQESQSLWMAARCMGKSSIQNLLSISAC